MILGTGIDIIEVARIRSSIERFGEPGEVPWMRYPAVSFVAAVRRLRSERAPKT